MASAPPATPESIAKRTASINDAIARVSAAAAAYAEASKKGLGDGDGDAAASPAAATTAQAAQDALVVEARGLLAETQGPIAAMFDLVGSLCRTVALKCLLDVGVFQALPADGTPATADALVAKLSSSPGGESAGAGAGITVEKALLVRLLRLAAAPGSGMLAEVAEETYAQTAASALLSSPDMAAMFRHLYEESFPALVAMPGFFAGAHGWREPASAADNPYTFAHGTGGVEMWAHIARFPDRQASANTAMKARGFDGVWAVGLYPFAERLAGAGAPSAGAASSSLGGGGGDDEKHRPLVVDVGGGAGHTSRVIRELCRGLDGPVVLQDREEVVADAGDEDGLVGMTHDFFAEQPVKGAYIYYLRRILHDWSDDACAAILGRLAAAMDRGLPSRVVIAEQVLPARGVTSESALTDLIMMTFSGMERTEAQWRALLARAGLRVERIYSAPGSPFGAIEAVLA